MLAEIMQKSLKSIPSDTSIVDTADKMRQENISALLVERNGMFIGLLTDTDIVRKGVSVKRNLEQTTAEQLMTTDFPSIQVTRTSHEAHDMMGDLGVRHLIICEGDKIVGLVSVRDLVLHFKSYEPSLGVD